MIRVKNITGRPATLVLARNMRIGFEAGQIREVPVDFANLPPGFQIQGIEERILEIKLQALESKKRTRESAKDEKARIAKEKAAPMPRKKKKKRKA